MDKITYCNVCGNELSPNDRFCNICGAPVGTSDENNIENPTNELISDNYIPVYQEENKGNAPVYQEIAEFNTSIQQKVSEGNIPEYQNTNKEKTPRKKRTGLIAGIAVLICLLAAGLGTWYFVSHKDKDDNKSNVKTVEVVFDLEILVKDDVDLSDVKVTAEKDDEVVELEITGNKAVAQLAPGKWKIKAEVPNYEPIVQEIEVSEDTTEAQEFAISFDFTEQPAINSAVSDTSGEVTTEAMVSDAADEPWRQAYIDYLDNNNIFDDHTVPMELNVTPAVAEPTALDIGENDIGRITPWKYKLYDNDSNGIPELYYFWYFDTFDYSSEYVSQDGKKWYTGDNRFFVVTRYTFDENGVNNDSAIYDSWHENYDKESIRDTGDGSLLNMALDSDSEIFIGGIRGNDYQIKYYIQKFNKEPKAEINDDIGWRQAYIDYIKALDVTDLSMYIQDECFDWVYSNNAGYISYMSYDLKFFDYNNNGVPELCLAKKWCNSFDEPVVSQYEFVEYVEDGNFDITHAAETEYVMDGDTIEWQTVVKGDEKRLYETFTNIYEEEDWDYALKYDWYSLASLTYDENYNVSSSVLNPEAITYIENYGK